MRIIYLPISQYTLNQLQEEESPYGNRIWDIITHLDRFPNETIESLNDLFTEDVVLNLLRHLADVDFLHWTRCKTVEGKEGHFLVISEYLYGDDYEQKEINGIEFQVKKATDYPTGILQQLDYYKLRDVEYDYIATLPSLNIIDALKASQDRLIKRVSTLLEQTQEHLTVEHELEALKRKLKTKEQLVSIYGSVNVEDLLCNLDVVVRAILSAGKPEEQQIAQMLEEPLPTRPLVSEEEEEDTLQELLDAQALLEAEVAAEEEEDVPDEVAQKVEQEEEEEDDDEEEEERLVDILDEMSRKELKEHIRKNNLDIIVYKGTTDDAIRDAILDATPDEYEDTDTDDEDADIMDTLEEEDDENMFTGELVTGLEESLNSNSPVEDEVDAALEDTTVEQKQPSSPLTAGQEYKEQIVDFITLMRTTNPAMAFPSGKKTVRKACMVMDKIVRLDGVDVDSLFEALAWGIQDKFWKEQIISLAALRNVSQSNDLMKYQNVMNAYLAALDKQTSPDTTEEDAAAHYKQFDN